MTTWLSKRLSCIFISIAWRSMSSNQGVVGQNLMVVKCSSKTLHWYRLLEWKSSCWMPNRKKKINVTKSYFCWWISSFDLLGIGNLMTVVLRRRSKTEQRLQSSISWWYTFIHIYWSILNHNTRRNYYLLPILCYLIEV